MRPGWAAPLAGLALAGCVAAGGPATEGQAPAVPAAELAARLPQQAAGLRRGQSLPLARPEAGGEARGEARGEEGREVAYTSRGTGPGATVEIGGAAPEGPSPAALEALLQEALQPLPHRRMRERTQFSLPGAGAGPAALRCAETEGSHGREPVRGLLCAGGFGGRLVRLRLTMPEQGASGTEPRAFATAITAALRGAPAGR